MTAPGEPRRRRTARAATRWAPLALALVAAAGCNENTAPGNDREAALEPPAPAAPRMSAGAALAGVDVGLLQPQIMTDADLSALGGDTGRCRFRMTKVGFPVFLHPASGTGPGTVKLNGKLVDLAGAAPGRWTSEGVEVTVRPLDDGDAEQGMHEAELVLRLPGAPNELGFHGFREC